MSSLTIFAGPVRTGTTFLHDVLDKKYLVTNCHPHILYTIKEIQRQLDRDKTDSYDAEMDFFRQQLLVTIKEHCYILNAFHDSFVGFPGNAKFDKSRFDNAMQNKLEYLHYIVMRSLSSIDPELMLMFKRCKSDCEACTTTHEIIKDDHHDVCFHPGLIDGKLFPFTGTHDYYNFKNSLGNYNTIDSVIKQSDNRTNVILESLNWCSTYYDNVNIVVNIRDIDAIISRIKVLDTYCCMRYDNVRDTEFKKRVSRLRRRYHSFIDIEYPDFKIAIENLHRDSCDELPSASAKYVWWSMQYHMMIYKTILDLYNSDNRQFKFTFLQTEKISDTDYLKNKLPEIYSNPLEISEKRNATRMSCLTKSTIDYENIRFNEQMLFNYNSSKTQLFAQKDK